MPIRRLPRKRGVKNDPVLGRETEVTDGMVEIGEAKHTLDSGTVPSATSSISTSETSVKSAMKANQEIVTTVLTTQKTTLLVLKIGAALNATTSTMPEGHNATVAMLQRAND